MSRVRATPTPLGVSVIAGAFGLLNLVIAHARPSAATIRTVDAVHLIATGMLFGVALAAFYLSLVRWRTNRKTGT